MPLRRTPEQLQQAPSHAIAARTGADGASSSQTASSLGLILSAGVQDSVKVLAKSLVRNRQYVTKMHHMKANLQAVSLKITVRASALEQSPVSTIGRSRQHGHGAVAHKTCCT